MTHTEIARIYVASLSDYNAGRLHGKWFDVLDFADGEDLYKAVKEQVLDTSPEPIAEEWAIHDYEGFGDITIHEYESFDNVFALAEAIAEHGEAFALYYTNDPGEIDVEGFTESYQGCWRSVEQWAEEYLESTGQLNEIPENLRAYFDVEKFVNDCELGGDIWSATDSEYQVHVFWNH